MTSTINLPKDGLLEYNNEMIVIQDEKNRKSQKWTTFSSALWGLVTGPLFLLREDWALDDFMMWVWLFVTVSHLVLLVHHLRLSYQEVIMLDEVKSARVKSRFSTNTLILKLRNGKRRQTPIPSDRKAEIRTFISANFPA